MSTIPDRSATVWRVTVPSVDPARPATVVAAGASLDQLVAATVTGPTLCGGRHDDVALRGLSLTDHPGWSADDLADQIVWTGSDRHDLVRRSPLTDFYDSLDVRLHAEPARVERGRSVRCGTPSR